MTACMGGWCPQRGHCAHFHAEDRSQPVERLCEKGREVVTPVRMHPTTRPAPAPMKEAA